MDRLQREQQMQQQLGQQSRQQQPHQIPATHGANQAQVPEQPQNGVGSDLGNNSSPVSDISDLSSRSSASTNPSNRTITLGEHIDAIIIQDYHRKIAGGIAPSNLLSKIGSGAEKSEAESTTATAIKHLLANTSSSNSPASNSPVSSPKVSTNNSPPNVSSGSLVPGEADVTQVHRRPSPSFSTWKPTPPVLL